jgi:hypothetical protein
MTAKQIIRAALRQINAIGATAEPSAADYDACLEYLNNLGDSWSAEGALIFAYAIEEFTLVAGTSQYTIGSGADFNTQRPAFIDSAKIKYPNNDVEYRVDVVPRNKFDLVSLQTTQGQPYMLFYNPKYPNGVINLYYTPGQAFTLKLNMRARLGEIANIATTVQFPEEYRRALIFNLAVDVANMYGFDAPNDTKRIARESKDVVMSINSANDSNIAEFDRVLASRRRNRQTTRGDFFSGN